MEFGTHDSHDLTQDDGTIVAKTQAEPHLVQLWQSESCSHRMDFRFLSAKAEVGDRDRKWQKRIWGNWREMILGGWDLNDYIIIYLHAHTHIYIILYIYINYYINIMFCKTLRCKSGVHKPCL